MRLLFASILFLAAHMSGGAFAQDISLRLPVACEIGKSCFIQHYVDRDPTSAARDFQCGSLTYEGHDGTDIRLPTTAAQKAGVEVVAAADGKVLRLRDGLADVSVSAAGSDRASVDNRECGNGLVVDHGHGWEAQYCHMAKGSLSVRPGDDVKSGDALGRVGLSGMTEFPHLHFTLRKDGKVVDPFAFGAEATSCGGGRSLWDAKIASNLAYRAGTVLNKGFAEGPVTMGAVEAADIAVPNTRSPALVAYVRAIGLKGGDSQILTLVDPDGKKLAENAPAALDRDKAQWLSFSGVKAPQGGFRAGLYRATYTVLRDGKPAIEQAFAIELKP